MSETLPPSPQNLLANYVPAPIPGGTLSEQQITELLTQQQTMLGQLQAKVSRKFYFALEERLQEQRQQFIKLLQWDTGKQTIQSRYSLVLDPQYFEQKFL